MMMTSRQRQTKGEVGFVQKLVTVEVVKVILIRANLSMRAQPRPALQEGRFNLFLLSTLACFS